MRCAGRRGGGKKKIKAKRQNNNTSKAEITKVCPMDNACTTDEHREARRWYGLNSVFGVNQTKHRHFCVDPFLPSLFYPTFILYSAMQSAHGSIQQQKENMPSLFVCRHIHIGVIYTLTREFRLLMSLIHN